MRRCWNLVATVLLLAVSYVSGDSADRAVCRDGPYEGGEFAGDGDADDIDRLPGLRETPISGAQPHLRLPRDVLGRLRQELVAFQDRKTNASRRAISLGALDEHAAPTPAACLRDAAARRLGA